MSLHEIHLMALPLKIFILDHTQVGDVLYKDWSVTVNIWLKLCFYMVILKVEAMCKMQVKYHNCQYK